MKNLVIISLDCVRREALSCYNLPFSTYLHKDIPAVKLRGARRFRPVYEPFLNLLLKHTMPSSTAAVDAFAADGALFHQAVSSAPFTPASHASVFTGLHTFSHGIRQFVGYRLSPKAVTIAERLKSAGFATGGFIGSNALGEFYGLNRGFDVYDFISGESVCKVGNINICRRNHNEVTEKALGWLDGVNDRFFLFVHYFDVHESSDPFTYQPFYQISKMKQVDRSIARIAESLKLKKVYDDTVFIILSDHGNDFGIHEPGHREYLYDTTLLVPLIIKADKSISGRTVSQQVRLIDIYPTVLELLDLPADNPQEYHQTEGTSLLSLCRGEAEEEKPAYSETYMERSNEEWDVPMHSFMSLRYSDWKIVADRIRGSMQLFNLTEDPSERNNVYMSNREKGDMMAKELRGLADNTDMSKDAMTEDEISSVKNSLKALGYL